MSSAWTPVNLHGRSWSGSWSHLESYSLDWKWSVCRKSQHLTELLLWKKIYEIDMHDRMSCMHFYVFKMMPYVSKLILAINKLNWLWDLGYHMLYYYVYVVSAPNISITMKWCSLWNGICTVIAPFYFIIGTRLLKRKYKIK